MIRLHHRGEKPQLLDDKNNKKRQYPQPEKKMKIAKIFKEKDLDLYVLFKEYLSRVPGESTDDPNQQFIYQRIWDETPYGLVDIQDERVIKKLPPNCYHLNGNKINLIQTVIRQPKDSVIIYNFDPTVLKELKTTMHLL